MKKILKEYLVLIWCTLAFIIISCRVMAAKPVVVDLTCEYASNPIGIEILKPRLSWKIQSADRGILQTSYELRVSTHPGNFSRASLSVWDSGRVKSGQSAYIPFAGKALKSATRYYWQVRIWDNKGNVSAWSTVAFWETGLLSKAEWKAQWIVNAQDRAKGEKASPIFRKEFTLNQRVQKARLYITAHGLYEAQINGKRVGEDYFTPGWTSYHKRLQYQVYDVTDLLKSGHNEIDVTLGEGWYAGRLSGGIMYGNQLALLSQLAVVYQDGRVEHIISDGTWKTAQDGPVRNSEIYNGEIYDARKVAAGWKDALVNTAIGYNNLVATTGPPVRAHEILKPVQLIITPKGEKVLDFGQNMVGWVRFKVGGKAGDSLVISHAEVLDQQGNFYTENLRSARQQIVYYLKGDETESYAPHFTFQGFRYVKIEGAKALINKNNIEAVVVHSTMKPTGTFVTSNVLINQLQHNILWGQKGNFLDVPTDCPQRDERLGWTGDAQVFFNTASFNMDGAGFFAKWLEDLKADQHSDGGVPQVIPNIWGEGGRSAGSAGWADAATIVPWGFYQAYGDSSLLAAQYDSMKAWAAYISSKSTNHLWDKTWHHGDWLYFIPEHVWDYDPAVTDKTLIAQAFAANTLRIIINSAEVLGEKEDMQTYKAALEKVKQAFVKEFMSASGALLSNTQTAYVLALQFDLLPEAQRAQAAGRLVTNIANYGNHLSTGFLGTPYLCQVLTRFGYNDLAYTLLMQETYPSWLYPVKMGATTIWERWDGIRPDGSFQSKDMNSFNHYAYGAIGDWMYKNISGITQTKGFAGYKEFEIAPKPGGKLSFAKAELETIYGKIVSSWKITDGKMTLAVEVPVNTQAHISFPNAEAGSILESGKTISLNKTNQKFTVGSGKYEFIYNY